MSGQGPPGVPPDPIVSHPPRTIESTSVRPDSARRVSSGASVNVCAVAFVRRLSAGKRADGLRRGIRGMGRGRGGAWGGAWGGAGGWVQVIKAGESDATRKAGFVMQC